ncbi:LuxR C-terminal-related transcriptional regulator [Pseudomonas sp. LFM046]|uniref:helix-turn-helix transcriptional regulator n=1 Tax=Pseudomonas sp. LFM046 TaxID=1608357 RepID=UPI0005CFB96F|nr:LuxR C-terminal-related transcriptional regulator [Pseudomonas sp. LFM046]
MHGQLTEWTRDIADVLAQPPGQPQLQALVDWLRHQTSTDHFLLFIYEGRCPPQPLFDTLPERLRTQFVSDYQDGPYLLDPFYLACAFGQADGLYSLRRLAPERFYATQYFCTYYQYLALSEQLGFIVSLGPESRAVLSLMRMKGQAAFGGEEMQLLRSAAPVVERVVRAAWKAHQPKEQHIAYDLDEQVCNAFEQFGQGVLSPRECQVARLVLKGFTNGSIAELLGIQRGTVKVHRRNLYDKLEIGSHAELLALFVRELRRA